MAIIEEFRAGHGHVDKSNDRAVCGADSIESGRAAGLQRTITEKRFQAPLGSC
jgi:hypothetical protein